MITAAQLRAMARGKPNAANLNSVLVALNTFGPRVGLDKPHRLAHFLAQLLHESGSFRYDREIWGPTPAQKRYDTRTDLGNTKAADGDGKRYMGRSAMQITGEANYASFTKWAKALDPDAPDFVKNPDAVNIDPWEGLGPLWYWDDGNPDGKSLNRYADDNNIEMVTRRINGGLNGYSDRIDYFGRVAMVLLGYGVTKAEIERFQREHPAAGEPDGVIGGNTRMALHKALQGVNPFIEHIETKVEVQVPVPVDRPVVPEKVEKEVRQKSNWGAWLTTAAGLLGGLGTWLANADPQLIIILIGAGVLCAGVILFGGEWIIRRVKSIRAEIEA